MKMARTFYAALSGIFLIINIPGCSGLAHVGTTAADAQQKPPVASYVSRQAADTVFTAAVKAMGAFGTVSSSDRTSGIVQGKKGNWMMNVVIANARGGSRIDMSARYIPSNRMDFSSRDDVTAEYISLIEKALGEKLALDGS